MEVVPRGEILKIDITKIDDPNSPMRSGLDMTEISALSESIKTVGLINPITVRVIDIQIRDGVEIRKVIGAGETVGENVRYEVVAGHRRLVACRIANYSPIDCVVRYLDDNEVVGVMAIENLDRENVDPVDEAIFIGKYIGEDDTKVALLSAKIKRSENWIRDRLEILTYSDMLIGGIRDGRIKLGVAKWFGRIENQKIQDLYVNSALQNPITVLQAEYQFNLWKTGALENIENPPPAPDDLPPQEQAKARAMCARCGKIAISPNLHSVFTHVECPIDEENKSV